MFVLGTLLSGSPLKVPQVYVNVARCHALSGRKLSYCMRAIGATFAKENRVCFYFKLENFVFC